LHFSTLNAGTESQSNVSAQLVGLPGTAHGFRYQLLLVSETGRPTAETDQCVRGFLHGSQACYNKTSETCLRRG